MARPRILVVEDEFLIRLTLAEALADDGFDVTEAGDAAEAEAILREQAPFALMLTDIHLPGGVDGLMLVERVRAVAPALPVIYMTGRPDALRRTVSGPLDVFIAKPYLPSDVCATARRMIGASV